MTVIALLLAGSTAWAAGPGALPMAAPSPVRRPPEETLRLKLSTLRAKHQQAQREAIMGGAAAELRDAVATEHGAAKKLLADRLPGMSAEPFDLCRDLAGCPQAPLSLHVEDDALIDDAFVALARPWIKLQEARGRDVSVTVDPGQGVKLALSGLERQPVVTLEAAPAPTGGFDVSLAEGASAATVYASERAAALAPKTARP